VVPRRAIHPPTALSNEGKQAVSQITARIRAFAYQLVIDFGDGALMIRDIGKDWKRWSAAERIIAAVFIGVATVAISTVLLLQT
jgi:hypothetical protein